jgi:hypothetical protein
MATYYIRQDGSNSNNGTSPNTAWATITYALANMVLTAGDNYLYIAPGVYRESPTVTITPTSTNRLIISGDPTATQFPTLTAGNVRLTGAVSDITVSVSANRLNLNSKSYITVEKLFIEHNAAGGTAAILCGSGSNLTIRKNVIFSHYLGGSVGSAINIGTLGLITDNNILVESNIIFGCAFGIFVTIQAGGSNIGYTGVVIRNNRIQGNGWQNVFPIHVTTNTGNTFATPSLVISNCIITQSPSNAINLGGGNSTNPHIVQNCIIALCAGGINNSNNISSVLQRNNLIHCGGNLSGTITSENTPVTSDFYGIDLGQALLHGFGAIPFGTTLNSRNTSFGTSSLSPTTDMYGFPWSGTSPDVGTTTYRSISSIGTFVPSERNLSSVNIASGSVSQSVEIYLGVTGLTATTTGLSATYNRTRSASVAIPLVVRSITDTWISGGFAEVDPIRMPGIYRIDIPNEVFAFGVDDVTVIVRGASGVNAASITFNMKNAGSNIVHMGPYKVIADGLGADQPIDIMQGVQAPVSVQVVDVNENGIDITGATVQAKVYNSAGTLVGTYTCTPTYAADGRCTFLLTTDVTNVAGVYSVTITRAVGGNVVVFGPLKVMVRAN